MGFQTFLYSPRIEAHSCRESRKALWGVAALQHRTSSAAVTYRKQSSIRLTSARAHGPVSLEGYNGVSHGDSQSFHGALGTHIRAPGYQASVICRGRRLVP